MTLSVLQIVTQREPAGAQRVAHRLDVGFAERGMTSDVAFLYRKEDAFDDESYVDLCPARPGPIASVALAFRLWRMLRTIGPDTVIAHGFHATVYVAIVATLARVRGRVAVHHVLAEFEGPARCRVLSLLRRTPLIGAHVYVSETTLESFGPGARRRSTIIHNGVDIPDGAERSGDGWARDPRERGSGRSLVLAVGRLVAQKDHRRAIEAVRSLPDVELAILGEGDLREELTRQIIDAEVVDRVHLMGNVAPSEVPDAIAAADVVIQPSVWEAFSMVILETMALGTPLVVSDIDAHREALGDAARFHATGDVEGLAAAIAAALADPDSGAALAAEARTRAEAFSLGAVTDRYADLVRAVGWRDADVLEGGR